MEHRDRVVGARGAAVGGEGVFARGGGLLRAPGPEEGDGGLAGDHGVDALLVLRPVRDGGGQGDELLGSVPVFAQFGEAAGEVEAGLGALPPLQAAALGRPALDVEDGFEDRDRFGGAAGVPQQGGQQAAGAGGLGGDAVPVEAVGGRGEVLGGLGRPAAGGEGEAEQRVRRGVGKSRSPGWTAARASASRAVSTASGRRFERIRISARSSSTRGSRQGWPQSVRIRSAWASSASARSGSPCRSSTRAAYSYAVASQCGRPAWRASARRAAFSRSKRASTSGSCSPAGADSPAGSEFGSGGSAAGSSVASR
jgi:hypothetical protein